jgi:hypothetical protein
VGASKPFKSCTTSPTAHCRQTRLSHVETSPLGGREEGGREGGRKGGREGERGEGFVSCGLL